jgi:hypothetical protein
VYRWLPECVKSHCRLIDCVIIEQEGLVRHLYSVDCFPEEQEAFEMIDSNTTATKKKKQMVIKQLIEENVLKGAKNALFMDEMDIQNILTMGEEFKYAFRNAVDYYLVGAWDSSIDLLKECLHLRPRDGPTIELFKFMEENNFKCPEGWKGYRSLVDKIYKISDF